MKIVRLLQKLFNLFFEVKREEIPMSVATELEFNKDVAQMIADRRNAVSDHGDATSERGITTSDDEESIPDNGNNGTSISDEVMHFINDRYDVRYNTQTRMAEMKRKNTDEEFKPVTKLERNTMVIDLHQAGCMAWNADVDRVLESLYTKQYNPLKHFLTSLPEWDGTERVKDVAARVSDDALWQEVFHRWMRMMVASWQNATSDSPDKKLGNYMIPLLVSEEQGMRKSTFCRMLLPEALRMLFTDKFELDGSERLEEAIAHYALINLDEFDRYSTRHMAKLKNLVQLGRMSTRHAYSKSYSQMERTASFIGTSNRTDLLTDPTGSRRFYCINVAHAIDCDAPIDYAQLYAQLLHEVNAGLPTFFTHEEEERIQKHNEAFFRMSPIRECFLKSFAPAEKVEGNEGNDADDKSKDKICPSEWLTTTDLFSIIRPNMRGMAGKASPITLGRELQQMHYPHRHTSRGTVYRVRRLS